MVRPHSETTINTAAVLSAFQLQWLTTLPLTVHIMLPQHHNSPPANIVVVHAGLVPEVPLDQQDHHAVMHLRSLVAENDIFRASEDAGEDGWAADWERAQEHLEESREGQSFLGMTPSRDSKCADTRPHLIQDVFIGTNLAHWSWDITESAIIRDIVQVEAVESS